MFESLTILLIWLLAAVLIWYLFFESKIVPVGYYTALGILTLLAFLTVTFMAPGGRTAEIVGSLLSIVLTPLGLSLLFLGRWTLREGFGKFATNGLAAAAFAILLVSSTPAFAYWLTERAERTAIFPPPPGDRPIEAIVLLGQGTTRVAGLGRPRIELGESADRVVYAAYLYRSGAAGRVVVTGGARPQINATWLPSGNCFYPEEQLTVTYCQEESDMVLLLERLGVPRSAIVIPQNELTQSREVSDIRTSALDVRDQLIPAPPQPVLPNQRPPNPRIALVASALSMKRATLAFEQVGFEVVPEPTDFFTLPYVIKNNQRWWRSLRVPDFIPSVVALDLTTRVAAEYLVNIFYFLRGWLSPFRV